MSRRRPAIGEALRYLTDQVMGLPGVVGIAEGQRHNRRCLRVFVVKKTPALLRRIPRSVKGYPVVIEETRPLRALDR